MGNNVLFLIFEDNNCKVHQDILAMQLTDTEAAVGFCELFLIFQEHGRLNVISLCNRI